MEAQYSFNLLTIAATISRRWRFILAVSFATAVVGLAGSLLRPKRYEAEAEFFLKNPFYADRNFIYNSDAKYIDYFASDDDIKHLSVLAQSDAIQSRIIQEENLAQAYKVDTFNAKEYEGFKKDVGRRIDIERTDDKSIELTYTDSDPQRAARIVNRTMSLLEQNMQHFYNDTRVGMYQSVLKKINEEEGIISMWTDSLVRLREKYGINDIISPARNNIMLSSIRDNGKPDFARGLELVQNIESMKDEMVTVRARNLSLAEQYATGTAVRELPLIYLLRKAMPPAHASGPGKLTVVVIAGAIGFIFCCLLVLITDFYRRTSSTRQ